MYWLSRTGEGSAVTRLRDSEGDIWEGDDEIGWTLNPEAGESWLANQNQLYIIWGPLSEVQESDCE